jgi:hypothetical protein
MLRPGQVVSVNGQLTLVGNPFAVLNRLWPSANGEKVSFHNLLSMCWAKPERQGTGKMVRMKRMKRISIPGRCHCVRGVTKAQPRGGGHTWNPRPEPSAGAVS